MDTPALGMALQHLSWQATLLGFAAPDAPQVFADGLHIVPHADGTVAIGSTSERDAVTPGPDAQLDALIARAVAICPALAGAEQVHPADLWPVERRLRDLTTYLRQPAPDAALAAVGRRLLAARRDRAQ